MSFVSSFAVLLDADDVYFEKVGELIGAIVGAALVIAGIVWLIKRIRK